MRVVVDPAGVVREFYERMKARNWDRVGELLRADVKIRYSAAKGERTVRASLEFRGRNYVP